MKWWGDIVLLGLACLVAVPGLATAYTTYDYVSGWDVLPDPAGQADPRGIAIDLSGDILVIEGYPAGVLK